jgi:hypothetical protein
MVDIKFLSQENNKKTFDDLFELFEGVDIDGNKTVKEAKTLIKDINDVVDSATENKDKIPEIKRSKVSSLASGSEGILKIPHKLPQEIEDLLGDDNLDKVNEVLKKYDLPEFTEKPLPKKEKIAEEFEKSNFDIVELDKKGQVIRCETNGNPSNSIIDPILIHEDNHKYINEATEGELKQAYKSKEEIKAEQTEIKNNKQEKRKNLIEGEQNQNRTVLKNAAQEKKRNEFKRLTAENKGSFKLPMRVLGLAKMVVAIPRLVISFPLYITTSVLRTVANILDQGVKGIVTFVAKPIAKLFTPIAVSMGGMTKESYQAKVDNLGNSVKRMSENFTNNVAAINDRSNPKLAWHQFKEGAVNITTGKSWIKEVNNANGVKVRKANRVQDTLTNYHEQTNIKYNKGFKVNADQLHKITNSMKDEIKAIPKMNFANVKNGQFSPDSSKSKKEEKSRTYE